MKKILLLSLWALASMGCVREPDVESPYPDTGGTIRLEVTTPGLKQATRLTSAEEDRIEQVDVLLFSPEDDYTQSVFRYRQTARVATGGLWEVELPEGEWNMAVVANASDQIDDANLLERTTTLAAAQKSIMLYKFDRDGSSLWTSGRDYLIPMSYLGRRSVIRGSQFTGANKIELKRMVAKIDLKLASSVTNFTLSYVSFERCQNKGAVLYDPSGDPLTPTGASMGSSFNWGSTDGRGVRDSIYVFEADYTGMACNRRAYLEFRGKYGTDTDDTRYRIELPDHLMRNHRYTFTITEILERGSENGTGSTQGVNVAYTTEVWDESQPGTTAVNEDEWMRVTPSSDLLFEADGGTQVLQVDTYLHGGYRISKADTQQWCGLTKNSFNVDIDFGVSYGMNQPSYLEVPVTVTPNTGTADRTTRLLFEIGRLDLYVTVTQRGHRGYLAPPGVLGVGAVSGELTLRGSKQYAGAVARVEEDSQFGSLADETVYIVQFKHGSTVALLHGKEPRNFDEDNPEDVVVWTPPGFTPEKPIRSWEWADIPYHTDYSVDDPIAGLGDPCRYADGANGGSEAPYRTPPIDYWWRSDFDDAYQPIGSETLPEGGARSASDWIVFMPDVLYYSAGGFNFSSYKGAYRTRDTNASNQTRALRVSESSVPALSGYAGGTSTLAIPLTSSAPIRCVPNTPLHYPTTLELTSEAIPEVVPAAGGSYELHFLRNTQFINLRAYPSREYGVGAYIWMASATVGNPNLPPADQPVTWIIAPNTDSADRVVSAWAYTSEYNGGEKIHIATFIQKGTGA